MDTTSVDLGFLEPCESWLLTNKFFRSKLGGKPAWLELKNLPKPEELLCTRCDKPLAFLCQVYAPIEENAGCFHRVLYVFVCISASCESDGNGRTIKVLRSQLPRRNAFYAYDPPDETVESPAVTSPVPLCVVCGCRGPKRCGRCQLVNYCGVVHQRLDWSAGHKPVCGEEHSSVAEKRKHTTFVFSECEIVTEPEEQESKPKLSEEENEKRQMEEFERLKSEGKVGVLDELPEEELDKYAGTVDQAEDKVFARFKKRTADAPDQVLRYERGGTPLWLSPIVPQTVPDCERCGSRRIFEFQVMPQLLSFLERDELDWGTLACYTCEASCNTEGYAEEWIFRQDVIDTTKPAN
uniref:Putative pcdc2/rp-8 programmed cell death protein 2 n=1 Tax=Anopheles marajoara TaxID=58244 RepID=A0A2M4BST4_9DIPT